MSRKQIAAKKIDMTKTTNLCIISLALLATITTAHAGQIEQLSLGFNKLTPGTGEQPSTAPASLTMKYGFGLLRGVSPYLGTGVAYILPSEGKPGETAPTRFKTGLAGQAGVKIDLGSSSLLKVDYQYLHVTPDATRGDSGTTPQSLGIGLEIKF